MAGDGRDQVGPHLLRDDRHATAVGDIVAAQLLYVTFRVATACGVFLLVLAAFGVFASPGGLLLAWLAQILIGLAFATVFFAFCGEPQERAGFRADLPARS